MATCLSFLSLVTLYEKLNELGEKKQSLVDEMEKENRGTPAEERERLLKQVQYEHVISHYQFQYIAQQIGEENKESYQLLDIV